MKKSFSFIFLFFLLTHFLQAQINITLQSSVMACNSSWMISPIVNGGVPPYTYQWSNNATTASIIVNSPANYCLTVADANGTQTNACINIIPFSVGLAMPVYCLGDPIIFEFTGGTPPYSIDWQGQTAISPTNTYQMNMGGPLGMSMVSFTDSNGCVFSLPIEQWGCGMGISGGVLCGNNPTSVSICAGVMDPPNTIYSWTFNGMPFPAAPNASCITASQVGNYCCDRTYPNGMNFNDCSYVNAAQNPIVNVSNSNGCVSATELDTLMVNVSNVNLAYVYWLNGQGTAFGTQNVGFSVTAPSTVVLQAISVDGCTAFDTVLVDWCVPVGHATGQVYSDINGNNIWDTGDLGIPYQPVSLQPGLMVLTQSSGFYNAPIDTAVNVSITTPNYQGQPSSPASQNAYVSNSGMTDAGNDFRFAPQQDLRVTLVATTNVSPGFGANYVIHYDNLGVATNAVVQMTYDPNFNNIHSVSPAISNQSGNVLTWSIGNLAPGASGNILIDFDMPANTLLGTPSLTKVNILPVVSDANVSNNQDSLVRLVTGAFDPNDKIVSFEKLTLQDVANAKPLDYTIRFQNTGTAPAQKVVVMDTLSANLNISSFTMLTASHDFSLELLEGHILKWTFNNIMLPDSGTNEAASHGYIRYRINPLTTLTAGTNIKNSASIYFDFNAPIKTPDAITVVMQPLGIDAAMQTNFNLSPNPATDKLDIQLKDNHLAPTKISLLNLQGQQLADFAWNGMENHTTIAVNNLAAGVYIVAIHTSKGVVHLKWVKN